MPVTKENIIADEATTNEAIEVIQEATEDEVVNIPKSVLDNILANMAEMKTQITRMSDQPKIEKKQVFTKSIVLYKSHWVDEQTALRNDWRRSPEITSDEVPAYVESLKQKFIEQHYQEYKNQFLDMLSENKKHIPTEPADILKRFLEFYWKEWRNYFVVTKSSMLGSSWEQLTDWDLVRQIREQN